MSSAIGGKLLFEDVLVVIPTSQLLGIVGENGTGKISLFRLLRNNVTLIADRLTSRLNFVLAASIKEHRPLISAFLLRYWPLTGT